VVTPYTSAVLKRGPRTTNVLLQDDCPLEPVEHVGIMYDPAALQWVQNALRRRGPANPAFKPTCA
jgi:triacylglycerol lipase